MKSIATVNIEIPTVRPVIDYDSGSSLNDYDIIFFNPTFPYYSREHFSAGGSCISIESSRQAQSSIRHWSSEIQQALAQGKTIFFLLSEYQVDQIATGSTLTKNQRTFHTSSINNYSVLPISLVPRNSNGSKINLKDSRFTDLFKTLKDEMQYKVILPENTGVPIFTSNGDVGLLGSLLHVEGMPGNLILLPYFDISNEVKELKTKTVWNKKALGIATSLIKQFTSIDNQLRKQSEATPKPEWVSEQPEPGVTLAINRQIEETAKKISTLKAKGEALRSDYEKSLSYQALLYETGAALEQVIEQTLELLGYNVSNFRSGNLEIDHIIVGPSELRMIGESEGKDTSAVGISKFRQLESNIGEDFERDEVSAPAKGIIFGNGFRFTRPSDREIQFTDKCITNAKRLGTALVQTSDLYPIAVHIIDNPEDEKFRQACRDALESTVGEVVSFPKP